jgi:hypothetical protein
MILKVFFGGLRGSRANYIWPLFWVVGLIHLKIRPITRQSIAIGMVLFLGFMYAYGFYKSFGADALKAFDSSARADMVEISRRSFDAVLLGDLGRADVQSLMLSRLWEPDVGKSFKPGYGATYLGAMCLLIPRWINPNRPPTKAHKGTELLLGRGSSMEFDREGIDVISNAYGLSGEAMLNFGTWGILPGFVVLAFVIGRIKLWKDGLAIEDSRVYFAPFFGSLCFYTIVWDSDVTLFYCITNGAVMIAIVCFSSTIVERRALKGRIETLRCSAVNLNQ